MCIRDRKALEWLDKEEPKRLENFAEQYGIPLSSRLEGELYLERTNEFQYYCNSLLDKCLCDFGERETREVLSQGKELEEAENRKLEALSEDLS